MKILLAMYLVLISINLLYWSKGLTKLNKKFSWKVYLRIFLTSLIPFYVPILKLRVEYLIRNAKNNTDYDLDRICSKCGKKIYGVAFIKNDDTVLCFDCSMKE